MESELESHFIDPEIPLSVQVGFFYEDASNAHPTKVDVVLEFPFEKLKHNWTNREMKGNIGVLGMAYAADGTVATRFSDAAIVRGDLYWGSESHAIENVPSRYETQLDLPPGNYELRFAISDGSKFGRAVVPIRIDEPDSKLALSSVFLFKRYRNAAVMSQEAAKINLAPAYIPIVSQEIAITPTADPTFSANGTLPAYFQIYDPMLGQNSKQTTVEVNARIIDVKSGKVQRKFLPFDAAPFRRAGTNIFAVHKFLELGDIAPGEYLLEVQAKDSAGNATEWRAAPFTVRE